MITLIETLDAAQKDLLKELVGKRLISIDAAFAAPPDIAWNTVRLHANGLHLDISCLLKELEVDADGNLDEHGVISVCASSESVLPNPGISADVTNIPINQVVAGVSVIEDNIVTSNTGVPSYYATTTKTVVLTIDEGYIAFDRQAWFDETLAIGHGPSLKSLVFDEWADWEDDDDEEPGVHYEFSKKLIKL